MTGGEVGMHRGVHPRMTQRSMQASRIRTQLIPLGPGQSRCGSAIDCRDHAPSGCETCCRDRHNRRQRQSSAGTHESPGPSCNCAIRLDCGIRRKHRSTAVPPGWEPVSLDGADRCKPVPSVSFAGPAGQAGPPSPAHSQIEHSRSEARLHAPPAELTAQSQARLATRPRTRGKRDSGTIATFRESIDASRCAAESPLSLRRIGIAPLQ